MDQAPPPSPVTVACLFEEAQRQALDPRLLLAIKITEAGRVGLAYSNTNGSEDLGPFQINTIWLPHVSKHLQQTPQMTRYLLATNGCLNASVAAWILRQAINDAGGNVWKGVAFYHSRNPQFGHPYAWRVHRNLTKVDSTPAATIVHASFTQVRSR